ncbi:uncharacterized protein [Procambarus clarkii]|uniref:uncharacterized protein n=1 Tax=Procambarus clarkii TaxID=6728 RepID=UPI003741FF0E
MPVFDGGFVVGECQLRKCDQILSVRWKDKREVNLLTTIHEGTMVNSDKVHRVSKEPVYKPDCVLDYNINIRLIDKADMMGPHSAVTSPTLCSAPGPVTPCSAPVPSPPRSAPVPATPHFAPVPSTLRSAQASPTPCSAQVSPTPRSAQASPTALCSGAAATELCAASGCT